MDKNFDTLKNNILQTLDQEQKEVVVAPLSNLLCIASAGSGKTHTLTNRIAYHVACGEPEGSFMLLTFTNKAAAEMTDRIKKLLNKTELDLLSGTFHSVAVKFLRRYSEAIGIKKDFKILSADDAVDVISSCRNIYIADNEITDKKHFPSKSVIYHLYSASINLKKSIATLVEEENQDFSDTTIEQIKDIIHLYINKKQELNYLDFDDLLLEFNNLLNVEEVKEIINDRYRNIFVDEYQDINHLQNDIIEKLNKHNSLTVVGDDCQCIYGFRGSNFKYILNFVAEHKDAKMIQLKMNYRSSKDIVSMAENSINNNEFMIKKIMNSHKGVIKKPNIVTTWDESTQAEYVANEIKKYVKETDCKLSNIAILVRANSHTRYFESALARAGIRYKLTCGINFFERKHIKALIGFVSFINAPSDEISFWKLMDLVDGIGEKTARKIFVKFKNSNFDFKSLQTIKVSSKSKVAYEALCETIVEAKNSKFEDQMEIFFEGFYKEYMQNNFDDYNKRLEDCKVLILNYSTFNNIEKFLDTVRLDTDAYENEDVEEDLDPTNKVIISTIHKAKGLEWDKVFVPYLANGIFPKGGDTEEERRLFYVAITRARKELDLICPKNVWNDERYKSTFIQELDKKLFNSSMYKEYSYNREYWF